MRCEMREREALRRWLEKRTHLSSDERELTIFLGLRDSSICTLTNPVHLIQMSTGARI